ncbi:hypothetical protein [Kribbella sp. NPDC050470]|uniref:hypothetical protein n=1 Tax=unclassified Kribbella TaxID=2644121 RepID=UPI0037BC696D
MTRCGQADRPYGGDALLPKVVDGVGVAAEAITSEGVTPALHPHVGSTIETEPEIRAVLDAVPASILSFGPDTGHLAWAGTSRTSTWPRRRPPGTPTRTSWLIVEVDVPEAETNLASTQLSAQWITTHLGPEVF